MSIRKNTKEYFKERYCSLKRMWIALPALKWLLAAHGLQSIIFGWIHSPMTLLLKGDMTPLLGIESLGSVIGVLSITLLSFRYRINHAKVVIWSTIGSAILIPFYAIPIIWGWVAVLFIETALSNMAIFSLLALLRMYLLEKEKDPRDHIGFTWAASSLWVLCSHIVRMGSFWFLEQAVGAQWIWAGIGTGISLLVILPMWKATKVQAPPTDKKTEDKDDNDSKKDDTISATPLTIFAIVFASMAIFTVMSYTNVTQLPHYMEDNKQWAGFLLNVGTPFVVLGGLFAALLPSSWGRYAVMACYAGVTCVAITFSQTNHPVEIAMGMALHGLSFALFNELLEHRMVSKTNNKTFGVAIPMLVSGTLAVIAVSGFGFIGSYAGHPIMYWCITSLGLLAMVSFPWLRPFLRVKGKGE